MLKSTNKIGFFSAYQTSVYDNIFFSRYLLRNTNEKIYFNNLCLSSENEITSVKSSFYYIWILSNEIPYAQKFFRSKKSIKNYTNSESKKVNLVLFLNKYKSDQVMHSVIKYLVPSQLAAADKVFKLKNKFLSFLIVNAQLSNKSYWIQHTNNSYIDKIPLKFTFKSTSNCFDQNVFFLKFAKFLPKNQILQIKQAS